EVVARRGHRGVLGDGGDGRRQEGRVRRRLRNEPCVCRVDALRERGRGGERRRAEQQRGQDRGWDAGAATGRGRAHGETLRCGGAWWGWWRAKGGKGQRWAGRESGAGEEVGGRWASGGVGAQRSVRLRLRVPVPGRS